MALSNKEEGLMSRQIVLALFAISVVASFFCASYFSQSTSSEMPIRNPISVRDVPISWSKWDGIPTDARGRLSREDHVVELMAPPGNLVSVSRALHYLYFFGEDLHVEVESGETKKLLPEILNGSIFKSKQPVFFRGGDGIVRSSIGETGSSETHIGQTLALLGDVGVSSNVKIQLKGESCTLADVITGATETYSKEGETEWLLIAFLHYLPPQNTWRNRWGEAFSFDSCARDLIARPYGEGACAGTHSLQVLSAMILVDKQYDIISDKVNKAARDYLIGAVRLLARNTCRSGGWNHNWFNFGSGSDHSGVGTIHVTGHHLEWLLDAGDGIELPGTILRGAAALCRLRLRESSVNDCRSSICPYTHAAKSLLFFEEQHTK